MKRYSLAAFVVAFVVIAALCAPASAHTHARASTFLFRDVTVNPGDEIVGDLNVIFGNAHVLGHVHGDLNVVGGACDYAEGTVDGTINCVQSRSLAAVAPWLADYVGAAPLAEQTNRLFFMLAANVVVLVVFLIFPMRVRIALARVETHPGLAAVVGTLALCAVVPVAILLALSILGIPLIVLEFAALFAAVWIGQGAIALLVGRRLCEMVAPRSTPTPFVALALGLVVISAAEIVPLVGWAVTALVWLVGLGAAVLAFVRTGFVDGPHGNPRAPIGGPPMTTLR